MFIHVFCISSRDMIQSLCNMSEMLILIVNVLTPRKQPEPPQLWGAEGHYDRDSVAVAVSVAVVVLVVACVVGALWQIERLNFSYLCKK